MIFRLLALYDRLAIAFNSALLRPFYKNPYLVGIGLGIPSSPKFGSESSQFSSLILFHI